MTQASVHIDLVLSFIMKQGMISLMRKELSMNTMPYKIGTSMVAKCNKGTRKKEISKPHRARILQFSGHCSTH